MFSPDGRYDPLFISNYLDVYVKDSLKRVKGVADVIIFGERKYSMRLWLDPVRMASRGADGGRRRQRAARTERRSRGRPGWPAALASRARNTRSACGRSGGLSEASQFDNIILKTNNDGTLVRVKDVGRSELGAEDYSSDLRVQRPGCAWASASRSFRTQTRLKCDRDRDRGTGAALEALPAGNDLQAGVRHDRCRGRVHSRRVEHR